MLAELTVVKETIPRSFVVETQEGNFSRNRCGLDLMPKDQDGGGGDMSVEEETADELGRQGMEDERDKLRDAGEGDKQVDTELNREPQDKEKKEVSRYSPTYCSYYMLFFGFHPRCLPLCVSIFSITCHWVFFLFVFILRFRI